MLIESQYQNNFNVNNHLSSLLLVNVSEIGLLKSNNLHKNLQKLFLHYIP